MKKKFITMAVAIISVFTASLPAKAFDLKDILGGNGGGIVGNLLELSVAFAHRTPLGQILSPEVVADARYDQQRDTNIY